MEEENKVRISKEITLCQDCPQHYTQWVESKQGLIHVCRQMPGLDRKIGFQSEITAINVDFKIPDICPKLNAKNAIRRDESCRT